MGSFKITLSKSLDRLSQVHKKFETLPGVKRAIILAIAAFFLLLFTSRFFSGYLVPKIQTIVFSTEFRIQIFNLVYFEWTALIIFSLLIATIICLLSGNPRGGNGIFGLLRLNKSPVIVFIVTTGFFIGLILWLPFAIFKHHYPAIQDYSPLFQHTAFIQATIIVSAVFGFSIADCMVKKDTAHWWTLPFLFISPWPVLWWNAYSAWLPSRLWMLFRAPLILLTATVPAIAFVAQPHQINFDASNKLGTPDFANKAVNEFFSGIAYQAFDDTDGQRMFINSDLDLVSLKREGVLWKEESRYRPDSKLTNWDEASFDYKNNLIYLFEGETGKLHIIDMDTLKLQRDIDIPFEAFPIREAGIHQCYFPSRNIFAIAQNRGRVSTFNTVDFSLRNTKDISTDLPFIWRILADDTKGKLYILREKTLSVYSVEDLTVIKTKKLPDMSTDMILDQKRNRLIVSFPRLMEIHAYDSDTLEMLGKSPAPLAVRPMALDQERDLLFLASFGGIVEMRNAPDFTLLHRTRLVPWIRRIEAFPKYGELVVTSGMTNPVIWQYLTPNKTFDPIGELLQMTERAISYLFLNEKEITKHKYKTLKD